MNQFTLLVMALQTNDPNSITTNVFSVIYNFVTKPSPFEKIYKQPICMDGTLDLCDMRHINDDVFTISYDFLQNSTPEYYA
jgi:hypothetical protein